MEQIRMRLGILTSLRTTVLKHCAKDLAWGLAAEGHAVEIVHEETRWCEDKVMLSVNDLVDFAEEWKPDAMIQFDGHRWNHAAFLDEKTPWICWMLDRLTWLYDPKIIRRLGPYDLTFSGWPELVDELVGRGYPPTRTRFLPVGVNTDVYNTTPESPVERFNVDIAFVCRLASLCGRERQENRMEAARIAIATGMRVGLYGEGWSDVAEFAPYAKGIVEPGRELKALFQRARLCIHANETTNWHMRVLECVSSGGRMALYRPPHLSHLDSPCALSSFDSAPSLEFLANTLQRDNLLVQYISERHSYRNRASRIVRALEENGCAFTSTVTTAAK